MRRQPLRAILAGNIRAVVRSRGMTLNAAADFAVVSRSQMFAVLACQTAPSIDWLAKVAEALEVEPWELLRPAPRKGGSGPTR